MFLESNYWSESQTTKFHDGLMNDVVNEYRIIQFYFATVLPGIENNVFNLRASAMSLGAWFLVLTGYSLYVSLLVDGIT